MAKMSLARRVRMRAPTYWKYMREKPGWGIMFLLARILAARRIERFFASAPVRIPARVSGSMFPALDAPTVVSSLDRDGCYLGLNLPENIAGEVRSFAERNSCFSRADTANGFLPNRYREVNKESARDVLAGYYFESVEDCPAIVRLRSDPALYSIASAYLGQKAFPVRTRLWWTFPSSKASDEDLHAASLDNFHFDMNDWRTLKYFFYLTPTDELGGPHQCIPGSHRRRRLKHQLTFTVARPTSELEEYYDAANFVTITGGEGFGFAEDPFVFHRGMKCRENPRLMLELEYGVTPSPPSYTYGRLG